MGSDGSWFINDSAGWEWGSQDMAHDPKSAILRVSFQLKNFY